MKKVFLAGLGTALLLTGCGSTPDAVVDKMKQIDVTVCNNESDMIQIKNKIGDVSGEKWKVIPEHQKTLIRLQDMLKKIWKKEWSGYKLYADGEANHNNIQKYLNYWNTQTEYDPNNEDTGNITDNASYGVRSDTEEKRKEFLAKLEGIGFIGITKQVETYEKETSGKKSSRQIFINNGVRFELSREKKKTGFYNALTITVSLDYVYMPESLKGFIPDELYGAYQVDRMTTEGKVRTIQFSSFNTDDDNYRHGIYYVMDQKLLQAEFYMNVAKYDSTTGYIKKTDDYKIFDLPENEKNAIVKTFMMFGASKEQAEAAVKELETQKSYKGTAGDVHWYYDRTQNDSLDEEWRLRIE